MKVRKVYNTHLSSRIIRRVADSASVRDWETKLKNGDKLAMVAGIRTRRSGPAIKRRRDD